MVLEQGAYTALHQLTDKAGASLRMLGCWCRDHWGGSVSGASGA